MTDDLRARPGAPAVDPAAGQPFEVAGLSREGRRATNEDSAAWAVFGADASVAAYAVVCDGMGGHNAGEVASSMALRALRDRIAELAADPAAFLVESTLRERLTAWIEAVNREIHDVGVKNAEQKGMGTTLAVAVAAPDGRLVVANVGDSKIFVIRGVVVHQVSVDHTALAEQRRVLGMDGVAPEDLSGNPFAHALTRSIGQEKDVQPEVRTDLFLDRGDLAIVTSDGVTDVLESERFLSIVEHSKSLGEICESIYRQAYEAGSKDNITIAVVARGRPQRLGASADRPRVLEEGEDPLDATRPLIRGKAAVPVSSGESVAGGPQQAASMPQPGGARTQAASRPGPSRRGPSRLVLLAVAAVGVALVAAVLALVLTPSTSTEPMPSPVPPARPTARPTIARPTPAPAIAVPPEPTIQVEEVAAPVEVPTRPPAAVPTVAVAVLPGGAVRRVPDARPPRPEPKEPAIPPVRFSRTAAPAPAEPTPAPTRPPEPATFAVRTAVPAPTVEEPVPIREARLERARVLAERRFYSFYFYFDRPVRWPAPNEPVVPEAIVVLSRRKKELLDVSGVPLKFYKAAQGNVLVYRLETSRTTFTGDELLGDGDSVLIDFGKGSPFTKTQVTADVFTNP